MRKNLVVTDVGYAPLNACITARVAHSTVSLCHSGHGHIKGGLESAAQTTARYRTAVMSYLTPHIRNLIVRIGGDLYYIVQYVRPTSPRFTVIIRPYNIVPSKHIHVEWMHLAIDCQPPLSHG